MGVAEEFSDAVNKYWRLCLLWTTATVLLVASQYSLAASYTFGVVLFVLGAINLGAAGISCAYVIARDN